MSRFLFLLVFVSIVLTAGTDGMASTKKSRKTSHHKEDTTSTKVKTDENGVPIVRAASVYVVDAKTGQTLYEKNANEQRPPASTQKLLTALLVIEDGNLEKTVQVEKSDTEVEPVKLGFKTGQVYSRRALLWVMLVHSTNDVAKCLARDNAGSVEAFAAKMNRRAAELGMTHSHFVNPNGLPDPAQYSTAKDMSRVALAAYGSRTIRSIVSTPSIIFQYADGHQRQFDNTNHLLKMYPACTGMKTGFTNLAGKCLIASAKSEDREVIAVLLGDKTSVIWRDTYSILNWALTSKKPSPPVPASPAKSD